MRQVQTLAVTSDEKENDEEDKKEAWKQMECGQSAAQWGQSAAYPETWGTLERMTHREQPAFAQCCFLSHLFFASSHICCLFVCFSTWPLFQSPRFIKKDVIVLFVRDITMTQFVLLKPWCAGYTRWSKVKTVPLCSLLRLWGGLLLQHREQVPEWVHQINQGIGLKKILNVYIIPNI